jgi:hypothetical protein
MANMDYEILEVHILPLQADISSPRRKPAKGFSFREEMWSLSVGDLSSPRANNLRVANCYVRLSRLGNLGNALLNALAWQ